MTLTILFWMIYILALLFGFWSNYEANQPLWLKRAGGHLVLWLLVGIIGYRIFGPPIHG